MIRFIDIGGQITDGQHCFAWWNTVEDKFISFHDEYVWRSWDEFEQDYDGDEIERFRSLFPNETEVSTQQLTPDEIELLEIAVQTQMAEYSSVADISDFAALSDKLESMETSSGESEKTFTIAQIRQAFWQRFHKKGEMFFSYLGDEQENQEATETSWEFFAKELEKAIENE